MKILTDICVHKDVVVAIRSLGIEVIRAVDKGFDKTPDEDIYDYAQRHHYVIFTFDKDYGNTIRFDIEGSYGVIIVYVEEMSREEIISNTIDFLKSAKESTVRGKLNLIEWDGNRTWPGK